MLKTFLWSTFFLIVVMGVWAAHIGLFYYNLPFPPTATKESIPKEIKIAEGDSFKTVSDLLASNGLVTNALYFRMLGKWTKNDGKIQPGAYGLNTTMRPIDILNKLVAGEVLETQIIIREGLTSHAIAKLLKKAGLNVDDEFEAAIRDPELIAELGLSAESLEGYLFPATYLFPKGVTTHDIIRRLVSEFKIRFNDTLREQAAEAGMTETEVITLASIIDKETAADEERPIISAVFHNRLKLGMRLQSDPTVIFGIKNFNGDLTREDLRTPTPYNTYTIPGLPPGPISNPGEASLMAALNPAEVGYIFFVSKNNGRHHFSETLEEHNIAVDQYQRSKKGDRE